MNYDIIDLLSRLDFTMDLSDLENYVREIARDNWIRDGRPNGEEYQDHPRWGNIKTKDVHWRTALEIAETRLHHNAGGD